MSSKQKVLHAALFSYPNPGIIQQMEWEQKAANELGGQFEWLVKVYTTCSPGFSSELFVKSQLDVHSRNSLVRIYAKLMLRVKFFQLLKKLEPNYNAIVLRYVPCDVFQLLFLHFVKIPVFLVHHTLEARELRRSRGLKNILSFALESILGPLCIRAAAGIVGVTEEIKQYELKRAGKHLPSFVYPNGVSDWRERTHLSERGEVPELLFVASKFYHWHGLDLLLKSVADSEENFIIHLVGELSAEDKVSADKDPRIKCWGVLKTCDIEKIMGGCWIGLSSFALQRKNMNEACTLKVREYLAGGLAVYSGHRDVFPESFAHYKLGSCDISKILEFARNCRHVPATTVQEAAKKYVDKKRLLEEMVKFISEVVVR